MVYLLTAELLVTNYFAGADFLIGNFLSINLNDQFLVEQLASLNLNLILPVNNVCYGMLYDFEQQVKLLRQILGIKRIFLVDLRQHQSLQPVLQARFYGLPIRRLVCFADCHLMNPAIKTALGQNFPLEVYQRQFPFDEAAILATITAGKMESLNLMLNRLYQRCYRFNQPYFLHARQWNQIEVNDRLVPMLPGDYAARMRCSPTMVFDGVLRVDQHQQIAVFFTSQTQSLMTQQLEVGLISYLGNVAAAWSQPLPYRYSEHNADLLRSFIAAF